MQSGIPLYISDLIIISGLVPSKHEILLLHDWHCRFVPWQQLERNAIKDVIGHDHGHVDGVLDHYSEAGEEGYDVDRGPVPLFSLAEDDDTEGERE